MTAIGGVDVPAQYAPTVIAAAHQYNIRPEMLAAVLSVESGFRPDARSIMGAQGIAQFEPATAAQYGVNPNDPNSAIPGAAHYLSDLIHRYGSENAALQAYNSGRPNGAPGYANLVLGKAGGTPSNSSGGTARTVGDFLGISDALNGLLTKVVHAIVDGLLVIGGAWLMIAGLVLLARKTKTAGKLVDVGTKVGGKAWTASASES